MFSQCRRLGLAVFGTGQHGGAADSVAASECQGPEFSRELGLLSVLSFAYSPHPCGFPPGSFNTTCLQSHRSAVLHPTDLHQQFHNNDFRPVADSFVLFFFN